MASDWPHDLRCVTLCPRASNNLTWKGKGRARVSHLADPHVRFVTEAAKSVPSPVVHAWTLGLHRGDAILLQERDNK